MPKKFEGYKVAARIDAIINKELQRHPPDSCSGEEVHEWMNFTRTVRTSLDLVSSAVQRRLRYGQTGNDDTPRGEGGLG